MRGTFIYDITTTIGIVIMVFLIIYWSVQYGTDMVAGMMLNHPSITQGALASAASFSCRPYDYSFELETKSSVPATLDVRGQTVQIIPPKGKLRDWTGVERGGFQQYKTIEPSLIITCQNVEIAENSTSYESGDSIKFSVEKKIGKLDVKVK